MGFIHTSFLYILHLILNSFFGNFKKMVGFMFRKIFFEFLFQSVSSAVYKDEWFTLIVLAFPWIEPKKTDEWNIFLFFSFAHKVLISFHCQFCSFSAKENCLRFVPIVFVFFFSFSYSVLRCRTLVGHVQMYINPKQFERVACAFDEVNWITVTTSSLFINKYICMLCLLNPYPLPSMVM